MDISTNGITQSVSQRLAGVRISFGSHLPAKIATGLVALPLAYWGIGLFSGTLNSGRLPEAELPKGASYIVEAPAALLKRELSSGWAPNAVFRPIRVRIDIDAYQRGIWDVVNMATNDIKRKMTRSGSESHADDALGAAVNSINRPADSWSFVNPYVDAGRALHAGADNLRVYNQRMAEGSVPHIGQRIDIVTLQLTDLASLLSETHTHLEDAVKTAGTFTGVRATFYHTLGQLNAVCEIMHAAQKDFQPVLERQSATDIFDQATHRACDHADRNVHPWLVINARPYNVLASDIYALSGHVAALLNDVNATQTALAGASAPTVSPRGQISPKRATP